MLDEAPICLAECGWPFIHDEEETCEAKKK